MDFTLLTPIGGLVALVLLVPAAALLSRRRAGRRIRARLGLGEPRRRVLLVPGAALVATAGCLSLAAMQPVVSTDEVRRVRTDAEVFTVFDISRSMLARAAPGSPTRLERGKSAAADLRAAIPYVPVGIASVTDRTLPHLFPTADDGVFQATLRDVVGIERPPPVHTLSRRVTSLESLATIATQQFFSPTARHRVIVVFTDGETLAGARARLGPLFRRPPGITSVFVQIWGKDERVYVKQAAEPGYRPDPNARESLERLAAGVGGDVYSEGDIGKAIDRVPRLVGRGPTVVEGERRKDVLLAPPLAAAAFLPLALLLWRRDR